MPKNEANTWPPKVTGIYQPENARIAEVIKVMLDFEAYDIAVQFLQFIKERKEREKGDA